MLDSAVLKFVNSCYNLMVDVLVTWLLIGMILANHTQDLQACILQEVCRKSGGGDVKFVNRLLQFVGVSTWV
jgi:hypothetical protein